VNQDAASARLGGAVGSQAASNALLTRRLLRLTWSFRGILAKVLTYQLSLKALTLVGLGLVGLGVDIIMAGVDPASPAPKWPFGIAPPAGWSPMAQVVAVAVVILLIAVVRSILQYHGAVAAQRLSQRVVVHLRSAAYDKLQRLNFRFFDSNDSGSIINRIAGDVQNVRLFVDGVVVQTTVVALSLIAYAAYMFTIHAGLTVICLATTPILLASALRFSSLIRPAHLRNKHAFDRLILALSENVQGVHVVKAFGLQASQIEQFATINAEVRDQQRYIFWCNSIFHPLIGFLTQLNLVLLLAFGGLLFANGAISLGGILVFAWLLQQFSGDVVNVAGIANNIQDSLIGALRVFEILDAPIDIQDAPAAVHRTTVRGRVRFDGVTFAYHGRAPVLEDVDFEVEPGMCVAIVGPTGAGKSTLLSLIPRFYDPQRGRVLVDGTDVRDLYVDQLRRNIGLVFQESFLFSNTIAANIAYGHPEATPAQIRNAARIASADAFVEELRDGYATHIGERGSDLSGGQRQRLAIARAVLLEPAILILDDATAAIDADTEADILSALEVAKADRTTFIVTHRLSTLRRADRVLVMGRGRIVESGTHGELVARKGPYYDVARLQVPALGSAAEGPQG
jgi:ATP-binding cassette subfamily B protein